MVKRIYREIYMFYGTGIMCGETLCQIVEAS